MACVFGLLVGFLLPAIKVVMDNEGLVIQLYEYLRGYLSNGANLSVVFKLLVGTVGGMAIFGILAILLVARRNKAALDKIHSGFDLNSHYLVKQRGREAMTMAIVLFVIAIIVLYLFKVVHRIDGRVSTGLLSSNRITSGIAFPATALFATLTLTLFIVSAALIVLFGALNYGRYDKVPIGLEDDVLSFFKCFFGMTVIAIDRPVSINLNHAEVDFKTEGGKGFLYVYNSSSRIVISPRLEFYNGSFDELADYVERFAVHEDE